MKHFLHFALLLAPVVAAQNRPAVQSLPPLLDRELFLAKPDISGAQISPDGEYVSFLKPWKGTPNLWVKKTAEPFGAARLLTAETKHPVSEFLWTRNGKYICYIDDHDGDKNFNLYAVDPSTAAAPGGSAIPSSRNLTAVKGAEIQLYGTAIQDPDLVYVGINDRDKLWPDLYKVKVSAGSKLLIRENTERIFTWIFDRNDALRVARRVAENGDQELLRVEANAMVKIYSCGAYDTCTPLRFDKWGKRVYIISNKGAAVDLAELLLMDPQTGKTEPVESDPLRRVDFALAGFSDPTGDLAFTAYLDDRLRYYFKNKQFEADFHWIETKVPGKEIAITSLAQDERIWLVNVSGDTEPGETYVFDRQAHTLSLQFKVLETLPRTGLASMQSIRYKSSGGLEIPAYLTLPAGVPATNLPTLVIPHGGPWMRDIWGYNALAQLFANRGYAVLMPNFRGSTGYGKKFLNAGNGEWGRKMQDDLTSGVQYLISKGTTDAKRVGILGSTYGGYAALAGIAFTPDLYRAAVDIAGPLDLLGMLDSIPPSWEHFRNMMYTRTGDPSTAAGRTWLKERSPLSRVGNIKTPLLVVQGARDAQVRKTETDQMVVALRDNHVPVEYLVAPDEGHVFLQPVNQTAWLAEAECFLGKYLKGRYQEEKTPVVAKRLAEITIDPKSVEVAKNQDKAALGVPKLVSDLKPGYYRYQTKLSRGGKEAAINTATIIEEKDGAWMVTEMAEMPGGSSTDTAILEKGTLVVRKRDMKQGNATIDLDFIGPRAAGKVKANGQVRPFSAFLGGPIFAGAAGSLQSIGCLPLADGYTLSYRNLDIQGQVPKMMQLAVKASETVTVPAGTFEAFRVEISSSKGSSDKALVWIAKKTRQPVKVVMASSAMDGAVMTSELLP
jgi:dipeptidyl aminopeptidase/acylaminoacyl peptidase